jgi:hypothetical protein
VTLPSFTFLGEAGDETRCRAPCFLLTPGRSAFSESVVISKPQLVIERHCALFIARLRRPVFPISPRTSMRHAETDSPVRCWPSLPSQVFMVRAAFDVHLGALWRARQALGSSPRRGPPIAVNPYPNAQHLGVRRLSKVRLLAHPKTQRPTNPVDNSLDKLSCISYP